MSYINENFLELQDSYLFSTIAKKVAKYTEEHPESTGMGTTLVTALLTPNFLLIGNIGDSSGFVIRNHKLHKNHH